MRGASRSPVSPAVRVPRALVSWVPVRADSRLVSWVGVAVDSRSPVWPAVSPSTTEASSAGSRVPSALCSCDVVSTPRDRPVDSRSPVWPAVRPSTTGGELGGQQGAERGLQLRRAQHAEDRCQVGAGERGQQVAGLIRRQGGQRARQLGGRQPAEQGREGGAGGGGEQVAGLAGREGAERSLQLRRGKGGKRARQLGGRQRAEQRREVGAGGGGEQVAGLAGREGAERGLQLGRRQPGEGAGQVGPGQRREQVAGLGRGERAQGTGQLPVVGRGLQQLGGLQGVRGDQQVADVRRAEEEDQRLDDADRRSGDRGQQPRDVDPEQARAGRSGVCRVRGRGDRREGAAGDGGGDRQQRDAACAQMHGGGAAFLDQSAGWRRELPEPPIEHPGAHLERGRRSNGRPLEAAATLDVWTSPRPGTL